MRLRMKGVGGSAGVVTRIKDWWGQLKRLPRYHTLSLFRLDGGSEPVARGFALGALINFFPTFGFGVVVSGFLAGVCGGNVLAGFVGGAVFAVLWPLLFFLNMRVGDYFYLSPIRVDELEDVDDRTIDALVMGKTFLWGAVVNCLVFGLLSYGLVYLAHSRWRFQVLAWMAERRRRRLERRMRREGR